ncbi:MAG: hypothetical protein FD152_3688, partial [Xanthobacteraceae bacterium]
MTEDPPHTPPARLPPARNLRLIVGGAAGAARDAAGTVAGAAIAGAG